jgi:hypothetical protein
MMRTVLVVCGALLLTAPARASDPVAIYAILDKVELEPSEGQPERLRLWGTFCLSQGNAGSEYAAPAKGFIYFTLPKTKEDVARKEWADLKKLAGTKTCVAFGSRYQATGKVRTDKDVTKDAVPYTVGFGLVKVPETNSQAKKLLATLPKP